MIDFDNLLEIYLEKKGIDFHKVDDRVISKVVSRIEDDAEEYIKEEVFDKIADDWVYLEIIQELEKHPEWKLKARLQEQKE
jgi:hypothetical protein